MSAAAFPSREVPVVEFGPVHAHAVSMGEAIDIIARRAASGDGGFVLTPNVAHIAISRQSDEFAAAYGRCFLSLADGMPLVLLSRILGLPLRHKVSGSDLFEPLMARCARDELPVFFLGATPDACERAAERLRARYPALQVAGHDSSIFDLDADPDHAATVLRRARDAGARLIVACVPATKQLMLCRYEKEYRPAIGIGAGATLAFYVGEVKRAPTWMSRTGLEWIHRLVQEPGRLWRRYLLDSRRVVPIFTRMVLDRIAGRTHLRVSRLP